MAHKQYHQLQIKRPTASRKERPVSFIDVTTKNSLSTNEFWGLGTNFSGELPQGICFQNGGSVARSW